MDSDDDICVLQYSDEDIDVDASSHPTPSFPFPPFAPALANRDLDQGSHEALKIAFLTLKEKLTESKAQNQQLTQRVRELESSKPAGSDLDSFINIGESFDMMEDARYVATEGGTGSQPTTDMFVGAGGETLTANNMRRQMVPIATKMEGADARNVQYKERVPDKNQAMGSLNQQMVLLRQENARLQQKWEAERAEKDRALQSLQERCNSLLLERDRALKEGALLHASLQKANQEVSTLKEGRGGGGGEGGSSEAPPELVNELVHMRRVIDKLKAMVLTQKDCLVNQSLAASMRSSMTRSYRDSPSMEPQSAPHGGGGSGSHSGGQSWEMVNGASSLSAATAESQRQLQQRPPPTAGQGSLTVGGTAGNALMMHSHQNGRASPKNRSGPLSGSPNVSGQDPQSVAGQRLRSEGIIRRHSEINVQQVKSKTEVTRAHTLPQQTPRLADWMSNHYQQKQQGGRGGGEVVLQTGAVGLNQFLKDTPGPTPAPGKMESGQAASPRHMGAQYPSTTVYYPQQQQSPHSQPESTYDNIAYTSVATASTQGAITNTQGTIVPSMHILNQSSMTGARVLQSGSSGVTSAPAVQHHHQQPAIMVGMGRDGDGPGVRALPQEHSDVTQPHNPTDLELNPIRFVNQPESPGSGSNSDRKCPVCGQDFSHITMDEFQTHVFECFDDAEDTSNAPDTLQPQRGGQRLASHDRICPMCQQSFADTISQDFFESHVQSHFEDVVDHFEVLDAQRT